ncbi:MAG: T9SS type A sorting domain-containing protein [Crocinitomix sp.]|nr:T9SS type A sorting domain-containing protein [Crocinitomix sp.]
MKLSLLKTSVSLLLFAGMGQSFAQMDGANAFMLGDYVEIGINEGGYEGAPCPGGDTIHCRGGGGEFGVLGFTANPEMDGWIIFNGDFYSVGAPENGFGLEFDHLGTNYTFGNNGFSIDQIAGSITSYTETVDSITVIWDGTIMDLDLTVKYEIKKDEHFYTTSMLIDNSGLDDYTDVFYYRNFDPDNNQSISGSYVTTNTIESQSEMADDSVIVSASQDLPYFSEVVLHAYGEDWKGFRGGFSNRDASDMWNGAAGLTTTEGSSAIADQAFGVAYKIGDIPPGKAASEWFSFATAFKRDVVFEEEEDEPDTDGLNEHALDFKIYPNPTETGNVNIALASQFNFQITDLNGRVILTGNGTDKKEIQLKEIEKGIYFITLQQNDIANTQKLIIR